MNTAIIIFVVVGLVLLVVIAFVIKQWRKGKKEGAAEGPQELEQQKNKKERSSTPTNATTARTSASAHTSALIEPDIAQYNRLASGSGESTSLSSAPGANHRYTLSLNADATDPWAALGGISALTSATPQERETEQQQQQQRRNRRRSRHVSFIPPLDDIDIPPVPEMPSGPRRGPARPPNSNNLRPSASSPSMAEVQMPAPTHQRPPQPRGILRPSGSSANIQQQHEHSQPPRNRTSVFPIYPPQPAEDSLASMRRPDSFMPGEDVSVNRRESARYSQPPPSYDAVMASNSYNR
ncbi:hypothetical protein EV175_004238 [Coemansia sp. RSA 1933]|nr:hypothetical protein EV175_004238 [Coemansia sp. RSA 1933]